MTLQLEKWDCLGPKPSARAVNRGFATIFSGRQSGLKDFTACTDSNFSICFDFNVI